MKMNLKKKIIALAVLPALILGIASIVIALTTVKDSLIDEIQDSLQGTAAAALAAYDQNSGEYMMAENGDVWKGSYNISKSENLVDNIKSKSGMDVTFFYGKTRIMTSAMDDDGNRILASEAGDKIIKTVLEGGEEYFSKAVSLDGNLNYGYYMPVYQKGSTSEIIGMIFVGTDKSRKDAAINKIIWMIIISVILVMVLCVLASVLVSISISRSLREGIGIVQTVAKGELGVEISKKLLARKDEVGDLSQSIYTLQKELKHILKQIAEGTEKLTEASEELGITARTTNRTMQQVEQAVGHITESSIKQAENTKNASDHVMRMGEQISETAEQTGVLNENADVMRKFGEQAAVTIQSLRKINDEVEQSIADITRQTNQTNESAQKIREATAIITSIVDETNLLSLNASIEAARAGDAGKGFAVVASQIQKLAEQSNTSSGTIEEITGELISDSGIAVETMLRVKEIVDTQSRNMEETEHIVNEVMGGIRTSLGSIDSIEKGAVRLETSRNEIVQTVEDLSRIAAENAENTQKTCEQTMQVADTFERIEGNAVKLKEIADELSQTIRHFHL